MINRDLVTIKSHWCDDLKSLFLYHSEKVNKLVVIFPGGDGCCDVPLLHYARKSTLLSGCDVLSLSYGHIHTNTNFKLGDLEHIINDSEKFISKCMERQYDKIYFISKSFGSTIAGEVSRIIGYDVVKNVYLTPLSHAVMNIAYTNCVVIAGTEDKHFSKDEIDMIQGLPNVKIEIIKGAGHSLETDDYKQSLDILRGVTDICKSFVDNIL